MAIKKLSELTTEELQKALENTETIAVYQELPPVLDFIQRFGLKPGKKKVKFTLLFAVFTKYYPRSLSKHLFSIEIGKLFRTLSGYVYLNSEADALFLELKNRPESTNTKAHSHINNESQKRHFDTFFKRTDITKGGFKVPWFVLYHVYRCYCIDNQHRRIRALDTFLKYMKAHFQYVINDNGPLFFINSTVVAAVNKGEYAEIEKIYQEKKQKRKLRISGY